MKPTITAVVMINYEGVQMEHSFIGITSIVMNEQSITFYFDSQSITLKKEYVVNLCLNIAEV